MHEKVEQWQADQPPDDNRGDRVQDLLAWLARGHHQGHQRNSRRQRRHQHRRQPLLPRALNHLGCKLLSLVLHKVQIVRNEQNAVARCNARQRNKTHHAGHRERLVGDHKRRHRADRRHRQRRQYLQRQVDRVKQREQRQKHPRQRNQAQ